MSWLDSVVDNISDQFSAAGDLVNEYISFEGDRAAEQVRNDYGLTGNEEPNTQKTATAQAGGFDWQKAGVIVAAIGVSVAVYKLVK